MRRLRQTIHAVFQSLRARRRHRAFVDPDSRLIGQPRAVADEVVRHARIAAVQKHRLVAANRERHRTAGSLERVAGGAQDAHGRDGDRRISTAETRRRIVGGVVGDQHRNRTGILRRLHLDRKAADAAIDERDVAMDGEGTRRGQRFTRVGRHTDAVLCNDDHACDAGRRHWRAERRRSIAAAVDAGDRRHVEFRPAQEQRRRHRGRDVAARPNNLIHLLDRGEAHGGRLRQQLGELRVRRSVERVVEEWIGHTAGRGAGRAAHEARKPEAMPELVKQHDNQVVLHAVVVVEPEVEIEIAAELGDDFRCPWSEAKCRQQVDPGSLVRQGDVIVRVRITTGKARRRQRAEVTDAERRGRRAEHVRAERVETGLNLDVDVAVERRTPQVGRELKRNQPLLPFRGARVAAHRRRRRRIVETFVRSVDVDDRNVRAGSGGRRDREEDRTGERHWNDTSDGYRHGATPCRSTWVSERGRRRHPPLN